MSISQALIDKQASKRIMLAKIVPTRLLNGSTISMGSGQYSASMPVKHLSAVKRNGVALTRDTAAPTVNDHYYFDEATGYFQVKLASAPSNVNILTADFALYFSSGETVVAYDPPTGMVGDLVEYEPRIRNQPEFSVNINDIQNGVFSISGTSLVIENTDRELNKYLTVKDWFKFKDVQMFACYEDETNVEKFYQGVITDVDLDDNNVVFAIGDAFSKLATPAYLGPRTEAIANYTEFTDIYPKHIGQNLPMILASSSPGVPILDSFGYTSVGFVDPTVMNKGICATYTPKGNTSQNRNWYCCRLLDTTYEYVESLNFGTPNSFSAFASIGQPYIIRVGYASAGTFATHNVEVGDSFTVNYGPYTAYGIVTSVNYTDREIVGYAPNWNGAYWDTTAKDITAISALGGTKFCIALQDIKTGKYFFPICGYEYSIGGVPGADGGIMIGVLFANNFEATMDARKIYTGAGDGYADNNNFPEYGQFSTIRLDPENYDLFYKISVSDSVDFTFENVIKKMITSSGLVADTPFIDIPTALPEDTELIRTDTQIPDKDEMSYDTYLKYLQELLRPFACFLRLNSTGDKASIKGFASPSGSGQVFDEDNILQGSLSIETDFNDIITEIISYNDYTYPYSITVYDDLAEHLNGGKSSTTIIHLMQFLNDRLEKLLTLLKNRKATYRFQTATQGFNLTIGDSITLKHNNILGGDESANLFITGISKNIETVTIEASDLGGL